MERIEILRNYEEEDIDTRHRKRVQESIERCRKQGRVTLFPFAKDGMPNSLAIGIKSRGDSPYLFDAIGQNYLREYGPVEEGPQDLILDKRIVTRDELFRKIPNFFENFYPALATLQIFFIEEFVSDKPPKQISRSRTKNLFHEILLYPYTK